MQTVVGYYDWQSDEKSVSDQNFFVHCCGRYRLRHKDVFATERPYGTANYQLIYIAEGNAKFRINGKLLTIEKGNCILYRPEDAQFYYYYLEDHPDIYWVHFSYHGKDGFLEKIGWGKEYSYYVGQHNSYIQLFDSIIQELQWKRPYFEEELQLLIQQLLVRMSRNQVREKTIFENYNKEVEEAIRIFHLTPERNFTIKEFAKERGLNYYRFIDTFTRYVGVSPRQYIINIRMSIAKDLLMNSLFQVSEVARLTGYDNPLYFSRLFKNTWGMSPTDYKKQNQ